MHLAVVGGGTATNSLVGVFGSLASEITYIMPISDNGGSSSEILRVLGGPAIGDARSRLIRLMPPSPLRHLLAMRLPDDDVAAQKTWDAIVYGVHPAWSAVPSHIKHMYRAFLIHVHSELLRRNRPGREFRFVHASIGNLLLSGARIFFGSLDSAIEFVLKTSEAPEGVRLLPAMNTNHTHHIAAILNDETVIVGQTAISHPSDITELDLLTLDPDDFEDANMPFSHPSLSASQISFTKQSGPLPSPIDRVYYVNPYGQEIKPRPSSRVLTTIETCDVMFYSIGSLYTSIIPVLLLQGFAHRLRNVKTKILILNGSQDRETQYMDAAQHVSAAVKACSYSMGLHGMADWTDFVTHVVYATEDYVDVNVPDLKSKGIQCIPVVSRNGLYDTPDLKNQLAALLT